MEPDAIELRVLGCLLEKQRTTPDAYPLSLNALRLACNQSTNRDPVVDYDEPTIRDALQRLYRRRWTRLTSSQGSRAAKYRHLLDEALGLRDDELSLLAVLLLRGPQTPGELNQRVERLHRFDSIADVQATLDRMVEREIVARLQRRPGQKEERYVQLLGGGEEADAAPVPAPVPSRDVAPVVAPRADAEPAPVVAPRADAEPAPVVAPRADAEPAPVVAPRADAGPAPAPAPRADARLDRLEHEVAALRAEAAAGPAPGEERLDRLEREVAALRAELAALRDALGG